MKGRALLAGIAGVAGLVVASSASAQEPFDSKLQAATYNTKLVQAMDECSSPTTVIAGLDACIPANVVTAGRASDGFSIGKILVKSKAGPTQVMGILKSSGNGDPGAKKQLAGKTLRVRLVLRITKRTTTSSPTFPLTYTDQVLNCAPITLPLAPPGNGNFIYKNQLAGSLGCNLAASLANNAYQKEVVSAEIVDVGTGKTIAVPGVRKKP